MVQVIINSCGDTAAVVGQILAVEKGKPDTRDPGVVILIMEGERQVIFEVDSSTEGIEKKFRETLAKLENSEEPKEGNERLLTPFELSDLPSNKWINGRWFYDPYEITRKQDTKTRQETIKEVLGVVRDYFNFSFGEFTQKYPWVTKGMLPGDEIFQALKEGRLE